MTSSGRRRRSADRYEVQQPENWNGGFASFAGIPPGEIPVGIQLVVARGKDDRLFTSWRDRLIAEPDLLRRYNEFKLTQLRSGYEAYVSAKAQFIATAFRAPASATSRVFPSSSRSSRRGG
jgi:GrpB-like predicted nucleotidyltransferase (UPF0157 family)